MCGLFGAILPSTYPTHAPIGSCLYMLGILAEERGVDASGIATRNHSGTWSVMRAVGPFGQLHDHYRRNFDQNLEHSVAAIGHTRWATQGGSSKRHASPLSYANLLGSHNGDVDVDTIPHSGAVRDKCGATDSLALFAALSTAHTPRGVSVRRIREVLSSVQGRAALAWTDQTRNDGRIWLARGGLSPLALGRDAHGGVWWASVPGWLRRVEQHFNLPMTISLLPEGGLWSLTAHRQHVRLVHLVSFKPTVRPRDERGAHVAVWRGFDRQDRMADQEILRHRTAQPATLR